jgi:DNA sulfur modification protein DndD
VRFKTLTLRHWRSLLGEYRIDFADGARQGVTVLVGQNGAGKTALLNAFTWVLFGETTAGFRKKDDLFNHAALTRIGAGEEARMEVCLEFEHEGAHFLVTRYQDAERGTAGGDPTLSEPRFAATRRHGGTTEPIEQDALHAILPPGLHPFFFFPAENIGREFDQNDAAAVRASMASAIDVLLGIGRYDRALDVISQALSKHLKAPKGASSSALEAAEKDMKEARDRWDQKNKRRKELPDLIKRSEGVEEALRVQLEGVSAHRKALDEIRDVRADLSAAQSRSERAREEQETLLNRYACVIFGHEMYKAATLVLDEAHRKGEIPPKISAGLLRELIEERETCICGHHLGADEKARLDVLRERTVEDLVVTAASDLRGRLPSLLYHDGKPRDVATADELLREVGGAAQADSDVRRLTNQERELLDRQPDLSHADPEGTMKAWQDASKTAMRLKGELDTVTDELPALERQKKDAERKHQDQLKKSESTATVGRAREFMSNVETTLGQIQGIIRRSARQDVERAMNLFFQPLLLKQYRIELTEQFKYQVVDESNGREVGASSSEVALATFAFVGGLASLMPAYANIESLIPRGDGKSPGGLTPDLSRAYPVVLDAPYSPFGQEYSERFSEKLPDLLPQSVIIVREDQVRFLEPMLRGRRVGKAYLLRMHSGKEDAKTIQWLGTSVDYVVNTKDQEPPHSELAPLHLE